MERWLPIKNYDNYEVSDSGLIRNSKTGRILKTNPNSNGYLTASLYKNHKPASKKIHRLVADTFYDGDNEGLDVNHIDGNKLNNTLSNLEFCTRKENVQHAFQTGLKKPSRQIPIRVVETGEVYDSIRECGRAIGCDQSIICQCLSGRQKSCNGYHFEKV